ncbi:MAG: hypothetical protein L3V56_07940 [Candidatus Magnetoovum sp. WYHC-5]|nr:hypothetical protein [Candidatus Magnetoovum sp. WYHC-5]
MYKQRLRYVVLLCAICVVVDAFADSTNNPHKLSKIEPILLAPILLAPILLAMDISDEELAKGVVVYETSSERIMKRHLSKQQQSISEKMLKSTQNKKKIPASIASTEALDMLTDNTATTIISEKTIISDGAENRKKILAVKKTTEEYEGKKHSTIKTTEQPKEQKIANTVSVIHTREIPKIEEKPKTETYHDNGVYDTEGFNITR